jgi:hypothetical protein
MKVLNTLTTAVNFSPSQSIPYLCLAAHSLTSSLISPQLPTTTKEMSSLKYYSYKGKGEENLKTYGYC